MEIFNKIKKTFPNLALFTLALELERILVGCKSVLDVGCGDRSPLRLINKNHRFFTGVDIFYPKQKVKIHDKYFQSDVRKIAGKFKNESFDAVIALDLIEHLSKKDGDKLVKNMEKIAKKKVIILTPNGFVKQTADNNSFQEHISGWSIKDFRKRGYSVIGLYGPKVLRGEKAGLRFKPKIISGIISEISHYLITRHWPKYSYSIIAYKNLDVK